MHNCIDEFFDTILRDYEQTIRQTFKSSHDFTPTLVELKKAREELASLDSQLQADRYLIDATKRVCSIDMNAFVCHYQARVRQGLGKGMLLPFEVDFTSEDYPDMHKYLQKYLRQKAAIVGINQRDIEKITEKDYKLKLQNEEAAEYFNRKIKNTN